MTLNAPALNRLDNGIVLEIIMQLYSCLVYIRSHNYIEVHFQEVWGAYLLFLYLNLSF